MLRFEAMVSKVEKPGLLTKLARFVRNPVRDRSAIIQQHGADSVSKVKQALTVMLGRKRNNELVRKHEFDQLRTLQNRTLHVLDDAFASSFFHTHASKLARAAATTPQPLAPAAGALNTSASRAFAHTESMPPPGDAALDRYRKPGKSAAMENPQQEFALYQEVQKQQQGQEFQEGQPPAPTGHASRQPQSSVWVCPARLSAADVPVLDVLTPNTHLARPAMHRLLDWSALREITADAVAPLDAWFVAMLLACGSQRMPLRFAGTGALLVSLRSLTPAGNRSVERGYWNLRLQVLCALGQQDEFELAALDYCMTYESAPAEWQDASCQIEQVSEPMPVSVPVADNTPACLPATSENQRQAPHTHPASTAQAPQNPNANRNGYTKALQAQ